MENSLPVIHKGKFWHLSFSRLWCRLCDKDGPDIQTILRAAKNGKLGRVLSSYYSNYTEPHWREIVQLCSDLKDAGFLQVGFDKDLDGHTPIFLKGPARITIAGRDYLLRLEQDSTWRRALMWISAFLLGVVSSFLLKWLDIFIELYARKHGLR